MKWKKPPAKTSTAAIILYLFFILLSIIIFQLVQVNNIAVQKTANLLFWFMLICIFVLLTPQVFGPYNLLRNKLKKKPDESQEEFSFLVNSVKDYAIFKMDTDGYIQSWNKGAEHIKGFSEEEIIGKHISIFYTDEDTALDVPSSNLKMAGQSGRLESEGWRVKKDGSMFWADIVFTALYDERHQLTGFLKITRDVTERRKKQEEIRYLSNLVEQTHDAIISIDTNQLVASWNKAAEKIYGYSREQAIGQNIAALIKSPLNIEQREKVYESLYANGFYQGEYEFKSSTGESTFVLVSLSLLYEPGGAVTGYLAVHKNITERKKLEDELKKLNLDLEEKVRVKTRELTQVFERITDAFIALDNNWKFSYINKQAAKLAGRGIESMLGKDIWKDFPEISGSALGEALKKSMLEQSYGYSVDYFAPLKLWMELHIYPSANGISVFIKDITENKIAQEKVKKTNRLYLFISCINQMLTRASDEDDLFKQSCSIAVDAGNFTMAWIGILNNKTNSVKPVMYAGEERDYLSVTGPIFSVSGTGETIHPIGKAVNEGKAVVCNDIENDPQVKPWKEAALERGYLSFITLPIIKFTKAVGAFTLYAPVKNFFDLTEIAMLEEAAGDISFALENFDKERQRKKAEEELRESEKRYQTLAEVAPVGIFHTDASGYTTYVNPGWCQISGMPSHEALGNGWLNAVYEDDKETLVKGWQNSSKNKDSSKAEYRFVRPDGSIAWVWGQATPETNEENQVVGYVGTITDVTERKKAEQEIAWLNKEKETTLNRITEGVFSLDNNWRYTFLNDAALAVHPLGKEGTLGKIIWEVHPELANTQFSEKYNEAMATGKAVAFEDFYAPLHTWFSVKVYPSHDGLTMFYSDITERKKQDEKMKINELRLLKAQEIGKLGYWQMDVNSDKIWASKEAMHIYGFPAEEGELAREKIVACIIDIDKVKDAATKLVNDNKEYNIEIRINPANGTAMKYISALGELEKDKNGLPLRIVGTLQDITERVLARNEIIKEKNLSESIINSLPGIFYLYNRSGRFLRWNKNYELVTKYKTEEISGMHPLDFFDADEKGKVDQKILNTFNAGQDSVLANFLLKTKEKIPYYFTGKAIEYEGSTCLLGVGIDFSELVKAQQKVKETTEQLRHLTAHLQSIREEERKRIGREIHDELGQQLTAIKMDIVWIDKKIPEETPTLKNKIKNIVELLDGSNQSIRRILSELRPVVLDDNGLLDAIDWLGRQFTSTTGIPFIFETAETEIRLSESIATCIFRIYQEALTNITRYAAAGKVFSILSINSDTVSFNIQDDGMGFDPSSAKSNKSFGILGMQERVFSLGGIFELVSSPGNGTKIMVSLPADISHVA